MGEHHVGNLGYFYLAVFGVLYPLLTVKSARKLLARDYPPRRKEFIVTILSLLLFAALSILVAQDEYFDLGSPR